MNLMFFEGFESYLIAKNVCPNRVVYVFRFENGYGAVVFQEDYTYARRFNMWELGVINFDDGGDNYHLNPEMDITLGAATILNNTEVRLLLERIKGL